MKNWVKLGLLFFPLAVFGQQVFDEDQIPVITNGKLADMTENTIKMRNNGAHGDPLDTKISELTEEASPTSGDWLLCENDSGELRKCAADSFSGGGGSAHGDGVNCPAGQYPLGVDANGNVQDCTADVDTDTQLSEVDVDGFVANNGYLTAVSEGDVTQHQSALSITESQISDLSHTVDTNTQLSEGEVDAFVANNGYLTSEIDGSITNEIQDLSLSGNILSLTDDATAVDLSTFLDDTTLSESQVDAFVANNGYITSSDGNGIYSGDGTLSGNTSVTIPDGDFFRILGHTGTASGVFRNNYAGLYAGSSGTRVEVNPSQIELDFGLTGTLRVDGDPGLPGQVLTSNGGANPPSWETPSGGGASKDYAFFDNGNVGNVTGIAGSLTKLNLARQNANSNSSVFALASDSVTVSKTAPFEICASAYMNQSGTARSEVSLRLYVNGFWYSPGAGAIYLRGYDSGQSASFCVIRSVSSGDVFDLRVARTDGAATTIYQDAYGTTLLFKEL